MKIKKLKRATVLTQIINGLVILEHKAVDAIHPIHQAQLMTYLKLSGCQIGFLLNWNVRLMKDGIKRIVWNLEGPTPYPKKS